MRGAIRTAALGAVFLSGFLAHGQEARAQGRFQSMRPTQTAPPAAPEDTTARAPQAIPLSEIPLRAEEAMARLQTLETQLGVDPALLLIEDELPSELAQVSADHERLARIILEQLSLRELWNLESIWSAHEHRLSKWGQELDRELGNIAWASEVKDDIGASWTLTSRALKEQESPTQAYVDNVESVLDRTREVETTIRDRLNHLTALKSQLDDGLRGVQQVLNELQDARESVRGRVLSRTAPPVWAVRSLKEQSASQRAARMWTEDWEAIGSFVARNIDSLVFTALLFLVFAVLAGRLRDRIEREGVDLADESVQGAAATLRRPVSASFLVTVLVARLLWPDAPLIFWQLVAIVAVVPLYRLLPRSSNPVISRTIRSILLLFAVVGIVDVLIPPSLEYRLFNLVEAMALAAVTAWLLHGANSEQMRQTLWGRVVYRGLQVSLAGGVTSVVANVLGWTLLSEILLVGVLYSAFFGLGIVIAYRILAGLIRLVPRTRLGQVANVLREHGDVVTSRAITVLRLVAFGTWVILALTAFEIIQPIGNWLNRILTRSLSIGALEFSIDRIVSFAILILLTVWIARFVVFVLDVEVLPRFHKLKRGVANAISTVVHWALLGVGLLTAASALGLQAGQLAIVFGALGVGIGFGLQNIVSNFVSGLILIFEQPVKVGDKIEITQLSLVGEVRRIGIRASVVRTFDGAEVIVPNGNLISSEVVNWTLTDQRRRVRVEVGVAYGTNPHQVLEVLKQVADDHREVLRYPEPNVLFIGFGDSSLNFRLQFWTANFDDFFRIQSEITVAVHDALKEAGITIPFPQRDLHVKSMPVADEFSRGSAPGAGVANRVPDEQREHDAGGGSGQEPAPAG